LLSVIILGLVAMFGQTQRAFRLGMTQVDVLEGGRAVTDMIGRELTQMTPSRETNTVNFYALLPLYNPLKQTLPGDPAPLRTNLIEEMYFLTKENQTWTGIGYYIHQAADGVGTLYRYSSNSFFRQNPSELFKGYGSTLNDAISRNTFSNLNRIMDGVVHFKVRAYDTRGVLVTNDLPAGADVRYSTTVAPGEIGYYQMSNSVVPAFVELELGVLEERALKRARVITDADARSNFLSGEAGLVHLFRARVPVRNVDSAVYP
jgi:hypothetical protein